MQTDSQVITSTFRNTTPITAFLYKLYSVLFSSFFACSGANYPPPSPTPPFAAIRTWLSDIPVESDSFILNNVYLKSLSINDVVVLFCSVYPMGVIYLLLSLLIHDSCMDGREFFYFYFILFIYLFIYFILPRTEPLPPTKLYAKCLILTIVVLTGTIARWSLKRRVGVE